MSTSRSSDQAQESYRVLVLYTSAHQHLDRGETSKTLESIQIMSPHTYRYVHLEDNSTCTNRKAAHFYSCSWDNFRSVDKGYFHCRLLYVCLRYGINEIPSKHMHISMIKDSLAAKILMRDQGSAYSAAHNCSRMPLAHAHHYDSYRKLPTVLPNLWLRTKWDVKEPSHDLLWPSPLLLYAQEAPICLLTLSAP